MRGHRPLVFGALLGVAIVVALGVATHFEMGEHTALRLRAAIAFTALALSIAEARRRRRGPATRRATIKIVAALLATLAVGAYYNCGNPVYSGLFHRHDFFHYFLGAKYPSELGYTRIYECTARAQIALGQESDLQYRSIRDLENDTLVPGPILMARPDTCRPRFSDERWRMFMDDVAWFRSTTDFTYWAGIQADHGYNPSPVWTAIGHAFASLHAASRPFILALASLDLLLYGGIFGALGWAFGWRTACLAIVFWGCQVPANHNWVSGTFLRQDWLFALVMTVACLKKRRFFGAGAWLGFSTMLRLFPAVFVVGPLLLIARSARAKRRLARPHARFLAGGIVASLVLVVFAAVAVGPRAFQEFAAHIRVHESVPAANQMGVPTILMHDLDGAQDASLDALAPDPVAKWRSMRVERLRELRPVHVGVLVGVVLAFAFVTRRMRRLWAAAALSVVVLFAALQVACYYCAFFLVVTPLARLHRRVEAMVLATAGASALLAVMPAFSSTPNDEYGTQSLLFFALSLALLAAFWPRKASASAAPATTP